MGCSKTPNYWSTKPLPDTVPTCCSCWPRTASRPPTLLISNSNFANPKENFVFGFTDIRIKTWILWKYKKKSRNCYWKFLTFPVHSFGNYSSASKASACQTMLISMLEKYVCLSYFNLVGITHQATDLRSLSALAAGRLRAAWVAYIGTW